ncbi:hypothetical protein [Corynebacterium sp. HMSC30G07]|nr:hypothetical protein [Corynebacterium sp. HMSC30G07]
MKLELSPLFSEPFKLQVGILAALRTVTKSAIPGGEFAAGG